MIFIIAALILTGHFILPLILGGVILIGGASLIVLLCTIFLFATVLLLGFIFTGVGAFVLVGIFFAWAVVSICLFPVMFVVALPLFVLLGFVLHLKESKIKRIRYD
jgi:hypothetical protein